MCAMYGGQRDISLIKKLNEELIIDIIDVQIAYYKIILSDTKTNVYDESGTNRKQYYQPIKIPCLLKREEQQYKNDEEGRDYTNTARFAFLRDTLVENSLYVQAGDIIEWDDEFFEVDDVIENQYFVGKNTETNLGGNTFGYNVSLICNTHLIRRSKLDLVEYRHGINDEI